jgi:hypothetical protein
MHNQRYFLEEDTLSTYFISFYIHIVSVYPSVLSSLQMMRNLFLSTNDRLVFDFRISSRSSSSKQSTLF